MAAELGDYIPTGGLEEQQVTRGEPAETVGAAIVAMAENQIGSKVLSPVNMYGYPMTAEANAAKEREASEAARVEAIKVLDKDAFKLGDLNPLIHATDLIRKESVDAVRHTTLEKIQETK